MRMAVSQYVLYKGRSMERSIKYVQLDFYLITTLGDQNMAALNVAAKNNGR